MSRVLVASSYHLPLDPKEAALGKPYPPLGPLIALQLARKLGLDAAFYDPTFCHEVGFFEEALKGHRPEKVVLIADPHSVPQKQCIKAMQAAMQQMIQLAKQYGALVLVAGPDVSDHPERYSEADHAVVGEHEPALLDWLSGKTLPRLVPRRPLIRELDTLPEPLFEEVDLRAYSERWRARYGLWELNYSTARGCPYRCNWCAKPSWGRSYQTRSPASVAAALKELQHRFTPDRFWFTDDIFAIKPGWLQSFYQELQGEKIRYRCLTRADLVKDRAYVKLLAQSGCEEVWLGAESGSNNVLMAMDKDGTVEEIQTAAGLLKEYGIRRGFFLQLGYPGETVADVEATVRMVRELQPEEIGISVSYPLPGTVFYERMKDRLVGDDWESSMENRLRFESDLPQGFYDAVREVLRAEHALIRVVPEVQRAGWSKAGARRLAGALWHGLGWPYWRGRAAVLGKAHFKSLSS